MKPGDTITVRFRVTGPYAINKLPELSATVLSVEGDLVRFRYADDAELYAGLIGQVRLPRPFPASRRAPAFASARLLLSLLKMEQFLFRIVELIVRILGFLEVSDAWLPPAPRLPSPLR
jgi:hypothetical protein